MLNVSTSLAEAWRRQAAAAYESGQFEEALAAFERTAVLDPVSPAARHNVGLALFALRRFGESLGHFRRSLEMEPRLGIAWNSVGATLLEMGRPAEAVAALREGLQRAPNHAGLHSFLMCAMAHADASAAEIAAEAAAFGKRFAKAARGKLRAGGGPLRVGYVSGDFREHAVASFLLPALQGHERRSIECYCYTLNGYTDPKTLQLRAAAHVWRDLSAFTDDQAAAAVIRNDGIDVLVDLMGHTAGNRLGIFARRPAPAQVSWLGYSGPTGLEAIDFRLTDRVLDGGEGEGAYLLRPVFACYAPPVGGISVEREAGSAPRRFAAFHNPVKLSERVLAAWDRLLAAAAGTELMVILPSEKDETAERIRGAFREEHRKRVVIIGRLDLRAYMEAHRRVDVLLDTFPLSGHTATCHALYMGVPVVTLRGGAEKPAWQRLSASVLSAMGRTEWIAGSEEEYVRIAAELIAQPPERAEVRRQFERSPVMDATGFVQGGGGEGGLEAAYRDIFRRVTEGG